MVLNSLMNAKQWIRKFLTFTVAVVLAISVTNYLVNPYKIFSSSPLNSLLPLKKHLLSSRMTQRYEFERIEPLSIMMGTSRMGIFSVAQLAPYLPKPIQNLSLEGASVYEQYRYLRYAIEYGRVKHIIWSLDFFAFNPDKKPDHTFKTKRLDQQVFWSDYGMALFNFKTFKRAWKTLADNMKLEKKVDLMGQPFSKKQVKAQMKLTLNEYATHDGFLLSQRFKQPHSIDKNLAYVQEIISLCSAHKISCRLYTSPVSASHLALYKTLGLEQTFVYWKEALAALSAYDDFATQNSVTKNILNFRDSSHVIGQVGTLIFAKIFHDSTISIPEDFGIAVPRRNTK